MEGTTVLTIAIPVLVALAALVLFTTARRRDTDRALSSETRRRDRSDSPFLAVDEDERPRTGREVEREAAMARASAGTELERFDSGPPAPYVPPDPETLGVTRRQFFNRSIIAMFGLGLSGFGAAVLAFLWPQLSAGFGSTITVGRVDDILSSIRDSHEPFYVAEGRFYLNPYPSAAVGKAANAYSDAVLPGMEAGLVALYQKCPHLGCRVPWCDTSQWFECGCHGSKYSRVGEWKGGPAPRGMDRFAVTVGDSGVVSVDTSLVVEGPAKGTNTTGQEAEGPNCVGGGGDH
ncbi:MAG TPA: Rieske 2Fe-2S domain-containing protein [Acidimicrobiales bacterium]|nr:Rieske 2Fe-2S domain-containing protein [Acidimicrobiales bacterium]